jgi:hypothetical protein
VKGLSAAAVTAAIATLGVPAAAAVALVAVIAAAMLFWVLANPQRSRRAAELLRAAHGDQDSDKPLGGRRPAISAGRDRRRR